MSYETEFLLPSLGDGDGGGRLVCWLKQPGDSFDKDEVLLEIETDKAVVEVPAPRPGRMLAHVASVDDVVEFDQALARVEFDGEAPAAVDRTRPEDAVQPPLDSPPDSGAVPPSPTSAAPARQVKDAGQGSRIFSTPYARKLSRERNVDLSSLHGTGKAGRIIARDVLANLSSGPSSSAPQMDVAFDTRQRLIDGPNGRVLVREWMPRIRRSQATLFLLHGLFADVDTWVANATVLARRGVPVVAMDLPGHGASDCRDDSFDALVATVSDIVRGCVEGRVVLVGHSFGAAVAARVARQGDIEVSGLVLIAPVGLGTEIEQSFIDGMLHGATSEALEREMRKLTLRPQSPGAAFLATMRDRLQANADQLRKMCASVFREGVQQVSIQRDLEDTVVPTRIIQGRHDAIIPWSHALNAPARVALHFIPEAGHMPQWEASAVTVDIILATC